MTSQGEIMSEWMTLEAAATQLGTTKRDALHLILVNGLDIRADSVGTVVRVDEITNLKESL